MTDEKPADFVPQPEQQPPAKARVSLRIDKKMLKSLAKGLSMALLGVILFYAMVLMGKFLYML